MRRTMLTSLVVLTAVAMLAGLAQVARRLGPSVPIRYLTDAEVADISPEVAGRYRKLAGAVSSAR